MNICNTGMEQGLKLLKKEYVQRRIVTYYTYNCLDFTDFKKEPIMAKIRVQQDPDP